MTGGGYRAFIWMNRKAGDEGAAAVVISKRAGGQQDDGGRINEDGEERRKGRGPLWGRGPMGDYEKKTPSWGEQRIEIEAIRRGGWGGVWWAQVGLGWGGGSGFWWGGGGGVGGVLP